MDLPSYTRFIAALLFVLALIAGLTWIARRFGLIARVTTRGADKTRRLDILEILTVDARRRLILFRRDNVEHLVLLGADSDTLIETGISSTKQTLPQEPQP